MNIQQVRNATIIAEYGGKKILVDPMLGKKGSMPPFPFSRNQHLRNPLHELPFPVEEMLKGVDAVLLTHLHDDHIDEAAYEIIPEPTLKSKACLKCLYFTKIISDLCRNLECFSYLYTINQTE